MADGEAVPQPRSLHDIKADDSLAGWRDGATIAFVPLILDTRSPRRINVPWIQAFCTPSMTRRSGAG